MEWWYGSPNCVDDILREPDRDLWVSCQIGAEYRNYIVLLCFVILFTFIFVLAFASVGNGMASMITLVIGAGIGIAGYVYYAYTGVRAGMEHDKLKKRILSTTSETSDIFANFSKMSKEQQRDARTKWREAATDLRNDDRKERELEAAERAANGASNIGKGQSMQGLAALASVGNNVYNRF